MSISTYGAKFTGKTKPYLTYWNKEMAHTVLFLVVKQKGCFTN